MKKVDQTEFEDKGDCWRACLAGLLGLGLEDVPVDCTPHGDADNWRDELRKWSVKSFGLSPVFLRIEHTDTVADFVPVCGCIVIGRGPRGRDHCVLFKKGKLWHDPHPSRDGLVKCKLVVLLAAADPDKAARKMRKLCLL